MTDTSKLATVFDYFATPIVEPVPVRPWLLNVNGVAWLFATEGHFLVAVKGDVGDPTPEKFRKASRYIADPLVDRREVSFCALKDFAGKPTPLDVKCDGCGGSGRSENHDLVKCEHCGCDTRQECYQCGGDGKGSLARSRRCVVVEGVPFNPAYLAYALTLVEPRDAVTVGRIQNPSKPDDSGPWNAFIVDGGDWRIAIMSIRLYGHEKIERLADELVIS
jgi:hypothetical protein